MEEFIKDERAPLREGDLKDVHFFPANIAYKCDCTFELTPDAKPFELSTYSGITKPFRQYGIATCPIQNKATKIRLYTSLRTIAMPGYKDYLFLPFKDWTNGEDTYGGGRYIDLKTGDIQDGKVTIDFNKCYNPWCAYSDGYNCPIPPVENHLDVEIKAGEKMWTGKKKKAK
ncbi:MAG: DUF1684 domain-containing protein [Saprospiraceae bacterium]|nr:DUF1684 domain-containing protein [Saprospiraceae bacterium]